MSVGSPSGGFDYYEEEGDGEGGNSPFRSLLVFSSFKVLTVSLLSPFEVSKVLLQTQYLPYDAVPDPEEDEVEEAAEEEKNRQKELAKADPSYLPPSQGFVRKTKVLPPLTGQLHAMSLLYHKAGLFSLWTGNLLDISQQLGMMLVQPMVESTLNDTFDLDDDTPLELLDFVGPNLATNMASHMVCSALLTPIQLIRTRKVVQQMGASATKKYRGFLDACGLIIKEEGPKALFTGMVPNILQTFFARVMRTAVPLFIERAFGVDPDGFLFVFLELILGNLELIFTLPLETVRHRLQSQQVALRTTDAPFEKQVETTKIPYTGMVDCFQRIVEEEGFLALYRGWAPHVASNFMLSVLTLVSSIEIEVEREGGDDDDS